MSFCYPPDAATLKDWVSMAHPEDAGSVGGMPETILSSLYPEVASLGPSAGKLLEVQQFFEHSFEAIWYSAGWDFAQAMRTLDTKVSFVTKSGKLTPAHNFYSFTADHRKLLKEQDAFLDGLAFDPYNSSLEESAIRIMNELLKAWTIIDLKLLRSKEQKRAKKVIHTWLKEKEAFEAKIELWLASAEISIPVHRKDAN